MFPEFNLLSHVHRLLSILFCHYIDVFIRCLLNLQSFRLGLYSKITVDHEVTKFSWGNFYSEMEIRQCRPDFTQARAKKKKLNLKLSVK